MLTGGGVVLGAPASEWVGNERGCGILNSVCQFGEQTYNSINYSPAIWGFLARRTIILRSSVATVKITKYTTMTLCSEIVTHCNLKLISISHQ